MVCKGLGRSPSPDPSPGPWEASIKPLPQLTNQPTKPRGPPSSDLVIRIEGCNGDRRDDQVIPHRKMIAGLG